MYPTGILIEAGVPNSQVVMVSRVFLKTGFTGLLRDSLKSYTSRSFRSEGHGMCRTWYVSHI